MAYYISDNRKALAVVHDLKTAEMVADTYRTKGHQGVTITER